MIFGNVSVKSLYALAFWNFTLATRKFIERSKVYRVLNQLHQRIGVAFSTYPDLSALEQALPTSLIKNDACQLITYPMSKLIKRLFDKCSHLCEHNLIFIGKQQVKMRCFYIRKKCSYQYEHNQFLRGEQQRKSRIFDLKTQCCRAA